MPSGDYGAGSNPWAPFDRIEKAWYYNRDGSIDGIVTNPRSGTYFNGTWSRGPHTSQPVRIKGKQVWREPSRYGRSFSSFTAGRGAVSQNRFLYGSMKPFRYAEGTMDLTGKISGPARDGVVNTSTIEMANNDNRATDKMYQQLENGYVDNGTNIADARRTFNELSSLLEEILELARAFAQRNPRDLYYSIIGRDGWFTGLSRRWLQYIYGIKPLVQDCYDTAKLLQKKILQDQIFSVQGSSTAHNSFEWGAGPDQFGYYYRGKSKESVIARKKVYCSLASVTLQKISAFGLINPANVFWELTPWSFIIDWAVPVGSVLQSLTAPLGYSFVSGTQSHKTQIDSYWEGMECPGSPGTLPGDQYSGQPFSVTYKSVSYLRETLPNFPLPGLYVKSPFSNAHALNALALLGSMR